MQRVSGSSHQQAPRVAQQLRVATAGLERLIDSGVFYDLSRVERRRLVRPVIRLYRRAARAGTGRHTASLVGAGLAAAAVLTLAGCPTGMPNHQPSVWFERGEYRAAYGQAVRIRAEARDDDDDPLSFSWCVDGEAVPDVTGTTLEIVRRPETETTYLVSVTARDGEHEAQSDVRLIVTPPATAPSFGEAVRADFLPTETRSLGSYGIMAAFADLDDDGDPDLLDTTSQGGANASLVFVYLENHREADGVWFGSQRENPFGLHGSVFVPALDTAISTFSPVFADFDSDGDLDAVVIHCFDSGDAVLAYLENRGTPEQPLFDYPRDNHAGLSNTLRYGLSLAAGDLDGDGDIDLFHAGLDAYTYLPTIVYIQNDGTATSAHFAPPVYSPFGIVVPPDFGGYSSVRWSVPALADLDGDGDLDLLLAQYGDAEVYDPYYGYVSESTSRLYYQENTGTAQAPAFAAPTEDIFGLSVPEFTIFVPAVADIDGDGDLDMMLGVAPNTPDYSYANTTYDYVYAENKNFP